MGMRVLVTGSRGYIGHILCTRLHARGYDVSGVDSGLFDGCVLGEASSAWEERTADVRDLRVEDLVGFEAVLHLAALSNDPVGSLDSELTRRVNLDATLALARNSRDVGVRRFVFSSSCSIYGRQADAALSEDAPLLPLTAYAASKVGAELGLRELATRSFSPTFLRNATAYGWSPYLRFDLVLNNFVGCGLATGSIRVLSDGTAIRPLIHVEDVSDAFIAVLEAPTEAVHAEALNVGRADENRRIKDLALVVQQAVPGTRVSFAEGGGTDPRSYRVSFEKMRRHLPAFEPRWDASSGARQLVLKLREAGFRPETFSDPRFTRLAHLRALLVEDVLSTDLRPRALTTR